MIIHYVSGGTAAQRAFPSGNVFNYNLYFCEGVVGDIEFGLNPTGNGGNEGNNSYNGLTAWRAVIGGDTNSMFANPGFTVAVPTSNPGVGDFKPLVGGAVVDSGEPSAAFTPYFGQKDFSGVSRVANHRVDIGCYEFMSSLQSWRDQYFGLPDGGVGAGDSEDTDSDGVRNLVEYSQGMNPTIFDSQLAPVAERLGGVFRFTYRKNASELTYTVKTSMNLVTWTSAGVTEQSDGSGTYWRDFSMTTDPFFVRLEITGP
jgi:hypothetical protein